MTNLTQNSVTWINSLKKGEKIIVARDGVRYYAEFMGSDIKNEDIGTVTVNAEYAKIETIDFRNIFPLFPKILK